WLIVALGVFGVALIAVAFFAVQSMRSDGFYAVDENGVVVVYKGSPEKLLGLSLHTKAGEQPTPPIPVRDLPKNLQSRLRGAEGVPLNGSDGWKNLARQLCLYALVPQGDKVVILQGSGQNGCEPTPVADPGLKLAELPDSDRDAVMDNKLTFRSRAAAEAKLRQLEDRRDACRSNDAGDIKDCPGRTNDGGKRP
ncbi:MAG TPA: serine/threonine-protein phosphatase, partial [Thermomonospora sp.]|nr:serine/threonine-protein phosphatase [Thermomonospora sp.]